MQRYVDEGLLSGVGGLSQLEPGIHPELEVEFQALVCETLAA